MSSRMILGLAFLPLLCWAGAWQDDLWLGRGAYWTSRVGVAVTNPTDGAWEGEPITIPVGAGANQLPLAGVRIEELRLVDARGVQLEYGVWDASFSRQLTEGPVPSDAVVVLPVVCAAGATANYEIYFGNPQAWSLADFWRGRPSLQGNGDFEVGESTPTGWSFSGVDAQHRLSVAGNAASGKRCLHAVADEGANASWFGACQSGIWVKPGQTFTLRVKIRGMGVKGNAGWYVHAGNAKKGDVLNRVFHGGNGTFDWKTLEMKVTIPADCTKMTVGSVLRGTGEAWYDDFTMEADAAVRSAPGIAVGAVEKLTFREIGAQAEWLDAKWQYRVPVRLANFGTQPITAALASFALPEALHATRNPEYVLTREGREVKTSALGDRLLFSCELPEKSVVTFYLYVRTGASRATVPEGETLKSALGSDIPSDQVLVRRTEVTGEAAFVELLEGPANLVRNGSFERGRDGWNASGAKGVSFDLSEGGRFGSTFAKTTVPVGVRANWSGWRQTVPVQPGKTYFYGAFIGGDNLEAGASVHVHLQTAKGKLCQGGMHSAGRGVQGTAPWTPVFGTLRAADDTARAALQLTVNGTGTVTYDGVLFAEYLPGRPGDPEFAPAQTGDALQAVQVDPIVKVFRETPVEERPGTPFALALARNETEPLQIAVRAPRAVSNLELRVEAPTHAGAAPLAVEAGRVAYVPVDWPTAYYSCTTPEWELRYPRHSGQSDGWSGWWPDPIEPGTAGPLAANATQAFWINVKTTASTEPGVYCGRLVWVADGREIRTDAYRVTVWNFTLPSRPAFPAIYDLRVGQRWQALGGTADERREKLWAFLAEKKLCPDTLGVNVAFAKDRDGNVTADFTAYDKRASRYFDHYGFPSSYMPSQFYCFGWAMPPKKFLDEEPYEGKWPYEGADWTQLRPAYRRVYQQALKLYWDHVKAKGWANRLTLYISDEPHFSRTNIVEQMKALCTMIHEVDPAIPVYSSTWRHCPQWNGALDVWGAGHYGCFPVAEMEARAAAGKSLWWTTDGQMCTDTPYCGVERLLPHYAHKYHARAYEFWGATWLTYDPWKFGWHAYIRQTDTPGKTYWVRYPAGDGYLIYPPKEGGTEPVTTIRLEAARDGVEDYAYLQMLEARAKADPAAAALLAEFRALVTIPNAGGRYSSRILPEPEIVGRLRHRAGELLSR